MNTAELISALSGFTAIAVQIDKRYGAQLTRRLPAGWRWIPAVALATLCAVTEGVTAGRGWVQIAANAALSAIGAMGIDAGLTESPLPWSGGAGGKKK
jgi:TRAP-type C4-dicarboxylate transport system permease small subunit